MKKLVVAVVGLGCIVAAYAVKRPRSTEPEGLPIQERARQRPRQIIELPDSPGTYLDLSGYDRISEESFDTLLERAPDTGLLVAYSGGVFFEAQELNDWLKQAHTNFMTGDQIIPQNTRLYRVNHDHSIEAVPLFPTLSNIFEDSAVGTLMSFIDDAVLTEDEGSEDEEVLRALGSISIAQPKTQGEMRV